MHIGLVAVALPDSGKPTGVVTYVKILRDSLQEMGHKVTIVTNGLMQNWRGEISELPPPRSMRQKMALVADRLAPIGGIGRLGVIDVTERILDAHRREQFDTLEIEEAFGTAASVVERASFPLVLRMHGPHIFGRDEIETPQERVVSERRIAREGDAIATAAAVTSPSARLMEATLKHYSISRPLAEVIPNPIQAARAEQCWSIERCDPKQLLWVGRFDLRKGADIMLGAFAAAAARDPELTLVMAGVDAGLRLDDGTMVQFAEYTRDHVAPDIRARIRFLGPVAPDEIARLRLASGIAIVASRFENFAYSIAESMAIGAPMIVSDSFGNGEMIEDGRTGIVTPIGDIQSLANAISELTSDRKRMAEMGHTSWERCRDWLSPIRVAEQTLAIHERALASFSRR